MPNAGEMERCEGESRYGFSGAGKGAIQENSETKIKDRTRSISAELVRFLRRFHYEGDFQVWKKPFCISATVIDICKGFSPRSKSRAMLRSGD